MVQATIILTLAIPKTGSMQAVLKLASSNLPRACLLCLLCSLPGRQVEAKDFPEVRASTVFPQMEGTWIASPIVAVGDVDNIVSYGHQVVDRLPGRIPSDLHDLYWCQGDLHVVAVIKGELRGAARKYLWASTAPGCKLVDNNPKLIYHRMKTKFWFLREDGKFLRPTFDYNAYRFYGVFAAWSTGSPLSPRQQLGTLLLTPSATSDSLDDYARYFWNVVDIACELLGKSDCTRRIKNLATLGNPGLRESACAFLKGELQTDCPAK
jgi:hypothetical protein